MACGAFMLATGFAILPDACRAESFQVGGTLQYRILSYGGSTRVAEKEFEVYVDGCKALFRTTEAGTSNYVETAFDSGLAFTVVHTARAVGSLADGRTEPANTAKADSHFVNAGAVDAVEAPVDDGSNINYLWLAYGSRCYLSSRKDDALSPIWALDDNALLAEGFQMRARWQLLPKSPGLPSFVEYLTDGFLRYVDQNGNQIKQALPSTLAQGFTNATYEVISVTNIGGLSLPSEFRFTRFGWFSGDAISPRTITTARITHAIAGVEVGTWRPRFEGLADVVDNRFAKSNPPATPVVYKIRDGDWPGPADLKAN